MPKTALNHSGQNKLASLITGATSGLGLATAEALAHRGYHVIGVGRDQARCQRAEAKVRLAGDQEARFITADLSSLAEIRRVARELNGQPMQILINNVGAMFSSRGTTDDGFERTFALNHLGPFLLTNLLLQQLTSGKPSRIINLSSVAHEGIELDFSDLQASSYSRNGWPEYQRSKLANILFTRELHLRLRACGVTVNAVHPGVVATGFPRSAGVGLIRRLLIRWRSIGIERGISPILHLATAPEVAEMSGLYWSSEKPVRPSPAARDPQTAERLWTISEELTGISTSFTFD